MFISFTDKPGYYLLGEVGEAGSDYKFLGTGEPASDFSVNSFYSSSSFSLSSFFTLFSS